MPVMKFGKHQGLDYSELPLDYLQWIIDDSRKKLAEFEKELDLRKNKAENSWMNQIVERGYKDLHALDATAVNHPKLMAAYKALKAAISEAADNPKPAMKPTDLPF